MQEHVKYPVMMRRRTFALEYVTGNNDRVYFVSSSVGGNINQGVHYVVSTS
jgi:hypothetical protein